MNKKDLLFYDAYEGFYAMAKKSTAFQNFCNDAFGEDFSQDGFSDIKQINMILNYIPQGEEVHILDVGCGNGKMLFDFFYTSIMLFTNISTDFFYQFYIFTHPFLIWSFLFF